MKTALEQYEGYVNEGGSMSFDEYVKDGRIDPSLLPSTKNFVLISIKHSSKDEVVFWRANDAGYTTNPFAAGLYTEEQIKADPSYYNDGFNAVPIPVDGGLSDCGIKISPNVTKLKAYAARVKK